MQAAEQLSPTERDGADMRCAGGGASHAVPASKPIGTARPPRPRSSAAARARSTPMERQAVLATLHSERFVDQSPAAVYARLLDEGTYLCSQRTMYRLLERRWRSTRAARPVAPSRVRET